MKTQRLWMPIWGAAWLFSALAGCGTERDSADRSTMLTSARTADAEAPPSGQDFEFITFGGSTFGLVGVAKQPKITICLSGVSGSTQTQFESWIKDSVQKWLAPLRNLTSDAIASTVEVTGSSSGCDASVHVVSGVWGYTTISNNPVVTVGPTVPFGVVIHEFGHAFGLGDTYQNGQSGNCQPNQPQAVMCNISFSDLQPDDRAGLTEVFKRAYPNDRPGPISTPSPIPTPSPTLIPTPSPIPTILPTPSPEPGNGDAANLDDAEMHIAMFREGRLRQYRLYFSVIKDGDLPGLSVESCIGTKDVCQRTASMWQSTTPIKIRGADPRAKIFRSDDRAVLRRNASITVRASMGGVTKVFEFKAFSRNPQ